jgi:cytochrome P450
MEFLNPDHLRNPHVAYRQLRESSPVLHNPRAGCWMLFDHASVRRALTDHATFSSRAHQNGAEPFDWMIFHDPPRHARLRNLVLKAFTPGIISSLEPRILEISSSLLDALGKTPEFDAATQFAMPLPMTVIAELLGIPARDRARFQTWADATLGLALTLTGGDAGLAAAERYGAASLEMTEYLADVLSARSSSESPASDSANDRLLCRLACAEIEGERLSSSEILGFFQLLLLAGSETTSNLIGNTLICLLDHPDQRDLLQYRPELLPSAIEESLRFRSPVQMVFRQTVRDVELHGQRIPAGQLVLALLGAANRDPNEFDQPDRFDITRHPNPHLAFGHGIHFCLGAALGRLEATVALRQFLKRFPDFSYADSVSWTPRPSFHVHGPASLPLRSVGKPA